MDRVLKKPENRAAAIDTLCYIMQQSEAKVASSSPAALQSLLASVESVTDPRWGNEVAFLRSKLHALVGPAAAPPAAAPAAGPPQQQVRRAALLSGRPVAARCCSAATLTGVVTRLGT